MMKQKIKLLLLFLVLSFTLSAGQWFTLTHVNIRQGELPWIGWQKLQPRLEMFSDPVKKRITIYSSEIQIFDYVHLDRVETVDGVVTLGWATDTNYRKVQIAVTTLPDGQEFFTVEYQDVTLCYALSDQ